VGQPTQRAANDTARSNIEPAQKFPHANGQSAPQPSDDCYCGWDAGHHTLSTASQSFLAFWYPPPPPAVAQALGYWHALKKFVHAYMKAYWCAISLSRDENIGSNISIYAHIYAYIYRYRYRCSLIYLSTSRDVYLYIYVLRAKQIYVHIYKHTRIYVGMDIEI